MTIARLAPAQPAPSLASALGTIRARGLRVSAIRRSILEALFAQEGPVSAEALAGRLPHGDLASVYRNLEQLEAIGLVRHVHLGHGPGLYAVATPTEVEFVTCERCGAFEAVDPARLDAARELIERELGYRPRFSHFPVVGVCAACADPSRTGPPAGRS
jgi:Fur family transcriptional regulator, ferric uptake regulator